MSRGNAAWRREQQQMKVMKIRFSIRLRVVTSYSVVIQQHHALVVAIVMQPPTRLIPYAL
jgi:hypothetical protein